MIRKIDYKLLITNEALFLTKESSDLILRSNLSSTLGPPEIPPLYRLEVL